MAAPLTERRVGQHGQPHDPERRRRARAARQGHLVALPQTELAGGDPPQGHLVRAGREGTLEDRGEHAAADRIDPHDVDVLLVQHSAAGGHEAGSGQPLELLHVGPWRRLAGAEAVAGDVVEVGAVAGRITDERVDVGREHRRPERDGDGDGEGRRGHQCRAARAAAGEREAHAGRLRRLQAPRQRLRRARGPFVDGGASGQRTDGHPGQQREGEDGRPAEQHDGIEGDLTGRRIEPAQEALRDEGRQQDRAERHRAALPRR